MPSLHIYNDSPAFSDRATNGRDMPAPLTRIGCTDGAAFDTAISGLWASGGRFDRIAIDTHGNSGAIYFGDDRIDACWWQRLASSAPSAIGTAGGHAYFSGCNVADTEKGWEFLTEAARLIFRGVTGRATGWTSSGIANPINGHTLHFWGSARTVFLREDGTVSERFEQ